VKTRWKFESACLFLNMHLVCTQMLIQTLQLHYIIEMFQNSHVEFIQEQLEVNRKIWGISESSWT
jgi:hypothetical protein